MDFDEDKMTNENLEGLVRYLQSLDTQALARELGLRKEGEAPPEDMADMGGEMPMEAAPEEVEASPLESMTPEEKQEFLRMFGG